MKKMRVKVFVLGFLLLFSWGTIGMAADFPERPIRLIIPWSAGAGNDTGARVFQPYLEKALGQKLLFENIPAGSTKMGTLELLKAKPDGYTLIFSACEGWIGYYYSKTYDFKAWEQMTPIGNVNATPYGFFESRTGSLYKTWADVVKAAKENSGKVTCSGPASGGMMEMLVLEAAKAAGVKITYVPFAGASKSGVALYGGHVDIRLSQPSNAITMVRAGKSQGLAVSTDKRMALLPDVPTFKELGIGPAVYISGGFWGPPKVPTNIVNTLTKAIEKATKEPEFIKTTQEIRVQEVAYRSPEKMMEVMRNFEKQYGAKLAEAYK
jgi:tripartite-type tricarboxylate transporter receptor subunit TctC